MNQEEQLLQIVEKVYAAALDDGNWSPALDSMADIFGAIGVSFEIIDKKNFQTEFIELGTRLAVVSKPEYLDYYCRISPRVTHTIDLPAGSVGYDYQILTEAEMDADEFYSDFAGPLGMRYFVSGHVLNSASHGGVFAAQRSPSQGHVGEEEIALMHRLLPHMQQAVDLRFRLHDACGRTDSLLHRLEEAGEAAIVVDVAGTILHVNGAAAEMLSLGDCVAASDRRLSFSDKAADSRFGVALSGLVMEAGADADMASRNFIAQRPSGKRPLLVAVRYLAAAHELPMQGQGAAAIVFIRDPSSFVRLDTDLLRASYQLSPAELEVAVAMDNGVPLRDLAEQRGVGIATVRSQLYALMAKMFVTRQTDLVRLLRQYSRPF